MFPLLFFLFIAMPILEIFLLIQVGGVLGVWTTLFIVILTAVLGTAMLRQQSLATIQSVQSKLNSGEIPATQLLEGVALLVGGVFLLTPGFVTDGLGFLCLLPLSRRWLIGKIIANSNVLVMGQSHVHAGINAQREHQQGHSRNQAGNPDVIEGEFRRED